ncbi:MAG TPA: Ig-like domain-containing protein, partial [Mycobacterium sp.]|nr:Ig-like domain-containing protein [Mycobacterium sp.]
MSLVPAAAFAVAAALVGCLAVEKVGPSVSVVASVRVWPTSAKVRVGETLQLTATPQDPAGAPLAGGPTTWASSDRGVATVSSSGLVTGVATGSATITATVEGTSGTAAIAVTVVPVASVPVWPATSSIPVGLSLQLTATPKDSAGVALPERTVTWMSSDPTVAPVSSSGLVAGIGQGSAVITATSEGKNGSAVITVR